MLNRKGLISAFLYGVCSTSMAFVNKILMDTYNFDYPFFIMSSQMVLTIVILEVLRLFKRLDLPNISVSRCWMFFPPALFYGINATLSLSALSSMNIPMYGVIKRCTPLAILILGTVILKKGPPSWKVSTAIASLTIGCIVAGYGDLTFDVAAYSFGAASVFAQAMYLILVQKVSQNKLRATETLHLNSYITLPFLLIFAIILGEGHKALLDLSAPTVGLVVSFILVLNMGCVLNYLLFLCTSENSALTTSIVGCLKSILQTTIGMFTFEGLGLNVFTITGVTLNLAGGIFYSYAKFQESNSGNETKVNMNGKDKGDRIDTTSTNGKAKDVEKC